MLWVDGAHVEIWCVGPLEDCAPLMASVLTAVSEWHGLELVTAIANGETACAIRAHHSRTAVCADPLAEAMAALDQLKLDWQDVTTRSAVACF